MTPQGRPGPSSVLIAAVATLILAVGVGFLIGRTVDQGRTLASNGTETIRIERRGAAPAPESRSVPQAPDIALKHRGESRDRPHLTPLIRKIPPKHDGNSKEQEEIIEQGNQAVLHPKVPLAKPTAQPGESCEPGTAGCGKDHKFHGVFFGEE